MRNSTYFAAAMSAVLLIGTGCSNMPRSWDVFPGQVVSSSTDEPVEGAVVLAFWWADIQGLFTSTISCFHVETAKTDNEGIFKIPGWHDVEEENKGLSNPSIHIAIYKMGYEYRVFHPKKIEMYEYALDPFKGNRDDQFKLWHRWFNSTTCSGAGLSEKNLYLLARTIHEESKAIARSAEEKAFSEMMKNHAIDVLTQSFSGPTNVPIIVSPISPEEKQKILEDNPN